MPKRRLRVGLESRSVKRRSDQRSHGYGLMRECQQQRHVQKKRRNAEHSLKKENKCERGSAAAAYAVPRAIRSVDRGQCHENICQHTVGKLNREGVIEEVEPRRMQQKQMLTPRNERTVN